MAAAVVTLFAGVSAVAAEPAPSPWAQLAAQDLQAVRAALEANHPGPVDPRNPGFRTWLEGGFVAGQAEARRARSFSDYRRTLLRYASGFHDGHIALTFLVDATRAQWPGFLVAADEGGRVEVRSGDPPAPLAMGDQLQSCDGVDATALLKRWVYPFYGYATVPQSLREESARLLLSDWDDKPRTFRRCRFLHGGTSVEVALDWRRMLAADAPPLLAQAQRTDVSPLGLTRTGAAVVISVPTFNIFQPPDAERMRQLLDQVRAVADRPGQVIVLDLRGNRGGNSSWAQELAGALWGPDLATAILDAQDTRVDWRVSPANLAAEQESATAALAIRRQDTADYRRHVVDLLSAAAARGQTLASDGDAPKTGPMPPPRLAHVFVFTDNACFSACLDFMDIATKVPGVVHIGLPTSADTPYVDNTDFVAPSGIVRLSYSMKVFRNRERKTNAWFEPARRWPGGPMSPETIGRWAEQLAAP